MSAFQMLVKIKPCKPWKSPTRTKMPTTMNNAKSEIACWYDKFDTMCKATYGVLVVIHNVLINALTDKIRGSYSLNQSKHDKPHVHRYWAKQCNMSLLGLFRFVIQILTHAWLNYFSPSFSPLVIHLQDFIGAIVSHVTLKYYGEKKQNSSQFRHFCFFEKCWTLLPNLIEPLVKIVISWKMNKTRTRMLLIIRDYVN